VNEGVLRPGAPVNLKVLSISRVLAHKLHDVSLTSVDALVLGNFGQSKLPNNFLE
jgi:hypothetical protein